MRRKISKVLSLLLCAIFLIGSVYVLPVLATTEGSTSATLTPQKMTYSHSHSTISGSNKGLFRCLWNNYCAVYAITLESDISFDVSAYDTAFSGRASTAYLSSYENAGNLDFANVYGSDASATHDELANMLRNNIYINGMSIAEAMEENTDYTTMSVLVGISGNKITVMVPVGFFSTDDSNVNTVKNYNNSTHGFYVGDFGSTPAAVDYTISITEGIEIGGVAVNPVSYQFTATNTSHASTGTFSEIIDSDDNANLTPQKMTYSHSHSTISGSNKGLFRCLWNNYCAVYAITLESDISFDVSAYDTAFSGRASTAYLSSYENAGNLDFANVYGSDASATHDELANMLRNNIYINGMSIAEAMEENTDYTTMSVLVGISGNKITVMVPVGFFSTDDSNVNTVKNYNNSTHGFYVGDFGSTPAAVDYTISITEGIEIGGVAVKPMQYDFTATNTSNSNTGSFKAHTHTPNTPVEENKVNATCTTAGSYDEVIYCSAENCGEEISRTPKTIEKLNHTPGTAVQENVVPASCKASGSYDEVVYCTVNDCKAELSRTNKPIDQLPHTPGTAVRENEVPASCKAPGSYDEVVYCTVNDCKAELSRTQKPIEVSEHDIEAVAETPATTEKEGTKEHYECTVCEKLFSDANGAIEVKADDLVIEKLQKVEEDKNEDTTSDKNTTTDKDDTTNKDTASKDTATESTTTNSTADDKTTESPKTGDTIVSVVAAFALLATAFVIMRKACKA